MAEVIYKFSELTKRAKQHAREYYKSDDYPGYDWWDYTYEDFQRIAAIMGIDIAERVRKTVSGKVVHEPKIYFSGFCSQGDGASFEARYSYRPESVIELKEYCSDAELIRINDSLTLLHLTRRLRGLDHCTADISIGHSYCHSGMMDVELHCDDECVEDAEDAEDTEKELTQLVRDLADWLYKTLEAEYDYLCSDEYVDKRLEDDTFDENGAII
jgi:hypothetical protein